MTREKQKRLGVGMFVFAWVMGLALITIYFQHRLGNRRNPNQQIESQVDAYGRRQVILRANAQHHYIASGQINDYPVTFLVDTGATTVAIPESLAREIGLRRGVAVPVSTAGGSKMAYATRLKTLSLGAIRLHDVPALINSSMDKEAVLLGMNVLRELEMRQSEDTLTLIQTSAR